MHPIYPREQDVGQTNVVYPIRGMDFALSGHLCSLYSLFSYLALATAYSFNLPCLYPCLLLLLSPVINYFSPLLASVSLQLVLSRSQLRYYFLCFSWFSVSPLQTVVTSIVSLVVIFRLGLSFIRTDFACVVCSTCCLFLLVSCLHITLTM
jgi:hypothetical protein